MPRFEKSQCLDIIKEDGNIGRYVAVLCRCKCGNIIRCKKTLVKNGRKKSCGCLNTEAEFVSKHIMRMFWTALLLNAKYRNIEIEIEPSDLDQIIEKQNFKCNISNLDITLPKNSKEFLNERHWTASIDRINSSDSYNIKNIQFVHKDINRMKMNLNQELFIQYCKLIAANN